MKVCLLTSFSSSESLSLSLSSISLLSAEGDKTEFTGGTSNFGFVGTESDVAARLIFIVNKDGFDEMAEGEANSIIEIVEEVAF
jgi:hypothetical protein